MGGGDQENHGEITSETPHLKKISRAVGHTYNPSYAGGIGRRILVQGHKKKTLSGK
jgi:hypothetical protein